MFGAFKATLVDLGGLVWKRPWRMSRNQKFRHRKRMQQVDSNIENLYNGLKTKNLQCKIIDKLMFEFPKESEMLPKDKYYGFNKHAKNYRKGVHLNPKWTKRSFRNNPDHF